MAYVTDSNLTNADIQAWVTAANAVDITNVIVPVADGGDGVMTWLEYEANGVYIIQDVNGNRAAWGNANVGITSCGPLRDFLVLSEYIQAHA